MKRQRPSLDTSFGSLSLGRTALSVSANDAHRVRTDSATSHSSSSIAFATPSEGRSPYHHPRLASLVLSSVSSNPTEAPTNDAVLNLTHSPHDADDLAMEAPEIYEYVKAKYDYTPTDPSGLSFQAGQFIQVHYKDESGWWNGEVASVRGWFPSNYLVEDSSKFVRASTQVGNFVAANRGYGASSPTPQNVPLANGAQQDWDALSFDDLIVLQTLLAYPSPISKFRQPDSTNFEDELNQRFMTVFPPSALENSTRAKTNGVQYLEVVHRALWVLENAAVATASQWNAAEGTAAASAPLIMDATEPSDAIRSSLSAVARDFLSPAIYCVIGSVRTALSSADCLVRNSVNLRTYPVLQNHRKDVLTGMARLVTQTKRLGHRGLDEPTSPLAEDRRASDGAIAIGSLSLTADGSGSSSGSGCSASLASVEIEDVEVRRELERSQCVYENVRRFIIAVFECGIVIEEPQYGVVSLLGLAEDEEERAELESEGEGSWEEDPSFRFRIATTGDYGGGLIDGLGDRGAGLSRTDSNRYAI
ncbi:hypothetical protein FRC17_000738, partial [Serendipita sp. 399]